MAALNKRVFLCRRHGGRLHCASGAARGRSSVLAGRGPPAQRHVAGRCSPGDPARAGEPGLGPARIPPSEPRPGAGGLLPRLGAAGLNPIRRPRLRRLPSDCQADRLPLAPRGRSSVDRHPAPTPVRRRSALLHAGFGVGRARLVVPDRAVGEAFRELLRGPRAGADASDLYSAVFRSAHPGGGGLAADPAGLETGRKLCVGGVRRLRHPLSALAVRACGILAGPKRRSRFCDPAEAPSSDRPGARRRWIPVLHTAR